MPFSKGVVLHWLEMDLSFISGPFNEGVVLHWLEMDLSFISAF
jgi:hypothetical protein